MKIIFLGTGEFGNIILEELSKNNYEPVSGRLEDIKKTRPDLIIVANFGKILPSEVLRVPSYGCLNVHPSLLPKHRGPTPVQSAILNNDKETGATVILMDEKIDHGPVLAQKSALIGQKETAQELCRKLAFLGAETLISALPGWIKGSVKPIPQDEKKASYSKMLTREDGKIDWNKSPEEIDRQVRAFHPWPGTYTFYNGKRLKILKTKLEKDKLIIEEVQPDGKKPMSFSDFLLGHPDFKIPC